MRGKRGSGKSVPYSTIEEIAGIGDLRNKSAEELRKMEIGLIKYTKQMYTRMRRAGYSTPMIEQLAQDTSRRTKTGKIITFARPSKNATKNQLINDVRAYMRVINSKYFGIKGGKEFAKYWEANFGGYDIYTEDDMAMGYDAYNEAWKIFTRIKREKKIQIGSPPEAIAEIYSYIMAGYDEYNIVDVLTSKYGPQAEQEEDKNEV